MKNINKNNDIPKFFDEEDLYDFMRSASQTTQEYFKELKAKKEDEQLGVKNE